VPKPSYLRSQAASQPIQEQYQAYLSAYERVRSANDHITVKQFSDELQCFIDLDNEQDELCYKEGVKNMDFDENLGAYPLSSPNFSKW